MSRDGNSSKNGTNLLSAKNQGKWKGLHLLPQNSMNQALGE